jgi:hypothetical protein
MGCQSARHGASCCLRVGCRQLLLLLPAGCCLLRCLVVWLWATPL